MSRRTAPLSSRAGQDAGGHVGARPERRTQADRRAKTRAALLEAAAHGLATYGFSNLVLEQVAREAGYTRGALYHLFAGKDELALAVVRWVADTWEAEVMGPAARGADPLRSLLAMAEGHARFCYRHDGARVMLTLRVEFAGQDHPVGRAMSKSYERLEALCVGLIEAARRDGTVPDGPSARVTARAFLAVLEALGIELADEVTHGVELTTRAARGVLGIT